MTAGLHGTETARPNPQSFPTRIAALLERWPSIGLVLWVAGLLRVASIFVLRSYRHPITWEFGAIADRIRAGFGYTVPLPGGGTAPSAYMPPAYSWVLVAMLRLGGDRPATWLALELIQAALGVLLVYILYRTALLLAERRVAIVAALLVAVFPTQIYSCNEFHSINFYSVLGAAAVFWLTRYANKSGARKDLFLAAVAMGLLMLFRAEAPALVLLFALILLLRRGWSEVGRAVAFSAVAFLVLAPWTLRNLLAFHQFVLVTDSAGKNLWIGNNPHATGSEHYPFPQFIPADIWRACEDAPRNRDFEITCEDAFKRDSIHFAVTHPAAEVRLAFTKLDYFFVFDPHHDKGRRPIYWVPSVLLSIAALYGAWLRRRRLLREDAFLVVSVLFAVAVTAAVFALPRYKIVIDPFLMFFAASILSRWKPLDLSPGAGTAVR
jgi:4-amino-4-deoxy-L-arabinose transferase-like glycosyltransferase